jgi:hypothetical protein
VLNVQSLIWNISAVVDAGSMMVCAWCAVTSLFAKSVNKRQNLNYHNTDE